MNKNNDPTKEVEDNMENQSRSKSKDQSRKNNQATNDLVKRKIGSHIKVDISEELSSGINTEKHRSNDIPNRTLYGVRSTRFRNANRNINELTETTDISDHSIVDLDGPNRTNIAHPNALSRSIYARRNAMSRGTSRHYANINESFKDIDDKRNELSISKDVQLFQVQPYDETNLSNASSLEGFNDETVDKLENSYVNENYHKSIDSDSNIGTRALKNLHTRVKYGVNSNDSIGSCQIVISGSEVGTLNCLRPGQDRMEDIHQDILNTLENVVKIHFDICEVSDRRYFNSYFTRQNLNLYLCLLQLQIF